MSESSLDAINAVALNHILPSIIEGINKRSPILDYMRADTLYYVYRRAAKYGYRNPYARTNNRKVKWKGEKLF